jgi:hypothetical protein
MARLCKSKVIEAKGLFPSPLGMVDALPSVEAADRFRIERKQPLVLHDLLSGDVVLFAPGGQHHRVCQKVGY